MLSDYAKSVLTAPHRICSTPTGCAPLKLALAISPRSSQLQFTLARDAMEELIARLVAKLGDEDPDQDIFDKTDEIIPSRLPLVERLRQSAELAARHSQMLASADPSRYHWEDDYGTSDRTGTSDRGVRPEETLEWLAAEEIERLRIALKKTCALLSGQVLTKEAMRDALEAARNALNASATLAPAKNKERKA
jgi:hypothetical protein